MSDCRHNAPNREPNAGDVQTQRQQLDEKAKEELVGKLVDSLYSGESGDEIDMEALNRCLEQLRAIDDPFKDYDVEQSLKDFHDRYDGLIEDKQEPVKKPTRRHRPLARIAIIAAALVCAFSVTAQAAGFDIFAAIARWTSETFAFVKVGEEEKEPNRQLAYESLQAALDDCNVVEKLSPTRFPDGTEMVDILVREEETGVIFSATYSLEGEKFYISILKVVGAPHSEVEINEPNVEVYEAGGIKHHLMSDVKQRKVTWYNDVWECYIAGDLSRSDMLMMIDSIYE